MELSLKDIERFWSKVKKGDGCWEWQGSISTWGYGHFRLRYTMVKAHRVMYFLAHGELPNSDIGHLCDNRRCVNPAHLKPQTPSENVKQAWDHGSYDRSRRRGKSKILSANTYY